MQDLKKDTLYLRIETRLSLFISSLSTAQKRACVFSFDSELRQSWYYTPVDRHGIDLGSLSGSQTTLAKALIKEICSASFYKQVISTINHEKILAETERIEKIHSHHPRSTKRYWLSFYGDMPVSKEGIWGFSFGGHHIALNLTSVCGKLSVMPMFNGVNPAEVRHTEKKGLRLLAKEEDMARDLLNTFSIEQKRATLVSKKAPDDIVTGNLRVVLLESFTKGGIQFSKLSPPQLVKALDLVKLYVGRMQEELSENYLKKVISGGALDWRLIWAGGFEQGEPHYYAITSKAFVIEYDNTQNGANHIHTVMRDFKSDWGVDLLKTHYQKYH